MFVTLKKSTVFLLAVLCLLGIPAAALAFDTSQDTQLLWLVNADYKLDPNFKAGDMEPLDGSIWQNGTVYMREEAGKALKLMLEGAEAAGYPKLTARSGYRSYATQSSMFNSRLAERRANGMSYEKAYAATILYTAYPGTSEHQTGLAQDLSNLRGSLNNDFGSVPAAGWLRENSWRYGFILRYTTAKQEFTRIADEPWHFRYVGTPHAQIIYENGWCYEEYIQYLQANGGITFESGDYEYEIFWTADTAREFDNIVSVSSDNTGGWIVTTCHAKDILAKIHGNWAEQSFLTLLEGKDFAYPHVIDPSAAITRADFALLYDLLGDYIYPGVQPRPFNGYSDVPTVSYYYDALNRLAVAGVMVGGTDNRFNPNDHITREATATAITNVIKDDTIKIISYKDIASISGWAFQSVQKVTYHGLMIGNDDKFNPQGNLTWAEAAAILCRLQIYLQQHQPADAANRQTP